MSCVVVDMRDAGCFGGDDTLGCSMWDDMIGCCSTGDAAMVAVGSVGAAGWATCEQPATHQHTCLPPTAPPTFPNDLMINAGTETGWAVTCWAENPEAALAFVSHVAGDDAQGAQPLLQP